MAQSRIDKQDVMDMLLAEGYQDELFQDLGKPKRQKGGDENLVTCPFCGKEGHFSYRRSLPLWKCWACGKGGDWIRYLELRERMSFLEALDVLAQKAGLHLSQESMEQAQQRARRADLLDIAQGHFSHDLRHFSGGDVREYLIQARGLKSETVDELAQEGLGAYIDRAGLREALLREGYTEQELRESGLFAQGLGEDYQLSILWRDRAGRPMGFVFRAIRPDKSPKYLNTAGLEKGDGLIGYSQAKGSEKIIIVEGVLDSYFLNRAGLPAVALAGTSLPEPMLRSMERSSTKELILALDGDEAGRKATERALDDIQQTGLRAYVATMPDGYKDPDELLRAQGLQALQDVFQRAESGARWRAKAIAGKHDPSSDRGRDEAIEEALGALSSIRDGLDRQDFMEALRGSLGLSEGALEQKYREAEQRAKQRASEILLAGLHENLGRHLERKDIHRALEDIGRAGQALRESREDIALPAPYPVESMLGDLLQTPSGLSTGYKKLDELLSIPPGAITIIAGRPGHGKTTVQLNLLVNMLRSYPDKSFCFFSYEEARKYLGLKMLIIMAGEVLNSKQNLEAYIHYLRDKRRESPIRAIEQAIQEYERWIAQGRLILHDEPLPGGKLAKTIGRMAQRGNLGACFVDYIQRIPWDGQSKRAGARYEEIKAVSSTLLSQAVATDVPIILGAQLGRAQGAQDKAKIRLDNLRESGDIEQDANTVIGLYNESVAQMEEDGPGQSDKREVPLEMHLLKRRGGQAGRKVTLQFDRPVLRIKESDSKFGR